MNYFELSRLALAEGMVVLTALLVLGVDLKLATGRGASTLPVRRQWACALGSAGCLAAAAWLIWGAAGGALSQGMLTNDALARGVKVVLLLLGVGTLMLSVRPGFSVHAGEYVAVLLLGLVGMLLMASAENVLLMFLALELASVSLYVLVAFDKRSARSTEAGLKYFLFGGMAGAFLLFGLSLVYGVSGSVEFRGIAEGLAGKTSSPVLLVGLVMILVGLGFKVAAVPFHFWAPDAYEGAPTAVGSFVAAASKVAAFMVLAKITLLGFGGVSGSAAWGGLVPGWASLVALTAAASMAIGNLAALGQRNVKRLLAYSAVAHAGYALTGVVAGGVGGMSAVMFYAVTYAVTGLGAFGVVAMVEAKAGGADWEHFRGLGRRSPALALCLGVLILSLAGIPPLAGFFGKFYVFLTAVGAGGKGMGTLWLVALGAATTCVSFYYYVRLLKVVFVEAPDDENEVWRTGGMEWATVMITTVAVIAIGCMPSLLLDPLQRAISAP